MSWNPQPNLGGARWNGNATLATTKQLISSVAGIYTDLQDISGFNFQNLYVSTLTADQWISTPELYVSSIKGGYIDISGIIIDASGVFNAPIVSLSSLNMKGFDNLLDLDVSFDFGLGKAIGGIAGGLGALVGGGAIGIGTGAGLAIQGAETGIATMVAGRGQNFLNSNVYETINFTSQLQVSTLGSAYPLYSSVLRTVSTQFPNVQPGREVFVSSFFLPNQICVRSVSDPFQLITGDSNLNTSTIQSFGEWVPLAGLEPDNLVGNSLSTNYISAGQVLFSSAEIAKSQLMDYNSKLNFTLGGSGNASLYGYVNQLYFQSDKRIVFSQVGDPAIVPQAGSLILGNQLNQSLLTVSSIFSQGAIQTSNIFASTITADNLFVTSTFFINNINQQELTVASTIEAQLAVIDYAKIGWMSSFNFSTSVGNPIGTYDIRKDFTSTGVTYNSISSFTNNILNYTLNFNLQDEPTFNMGSRYQVATSNVQQWASTILICDNTNGNPGFLGIEYPGAWTTPGGTFDLTVDMSQRGFYFSCVQPLTPQGGGGSNFINLTPNTGNIYTYRFTQDPSGWFVPVTPAGPPYTTLNNNTFSINQDINDVWISTTDRLNLVAGDIYLQGITHAKELAIGTINLDNLTTGFLSTLSTATFIDNAFFKQDTYFFSTIFENDSLQVTTPYSGIYNPSIKIINNPSFVVPSALSTPFNKYVPLEADFATSYQNPILYLTPGTNNDMSLQKLGAWQLNSAPQGTNYALGTFIITPPDNTFKIYTDNNGFGLASNLQVVNLSNNSPTYTMNLYIAYPSSALPIGPKSATSLYWNGGTGQWSQIAFQPIASPTFNSQIKLIQDLNSAIIQTPPTLTLSTNVLQVSQINYGTVYGGFYQPKMFRQIINGSFGAGGSASGQTQITNGSMVFNASLYNCQASIASFYCGNGSVAFNTVVLAPYVDSGTNTWYVNWSIELNAGGAGANWTISWNAFMFPYNMASS